MSNQHDSLDTRLRAVETVLDQLAQDVQGPLLQFVQRQIAGNTQCDLRLADLEKRLTDLTTRFLEFTREHNRRIADLEASRDASLLRRTRKVIAKVRNG